MKKRYSRPVAQMEQFDLDMHIAAPSADTEAYNTIKAAFDALGSPDVDGNGLFDEEADFAAFMAKCGYDNSTSGFCYHSSVTPS